MATNANSYDSAQRPFRHDEKRGKWEKSSDFHVACIGHAFRMKNFCILVTVMEEFSGVTCIIPVLFLAGLFIIPIIFIQSFLGQFSGTGYISAFRIAPIFKGIGYVILLLNFSSIIYSSSMATIPILYIFHSFGSGSSWMHCNNEWNSPNCTEATNETTFTPLWEYFQNHVVAVGDIDDAVYGISWSMCLVSVFMWILLAAILLRPIETIGKIIRYTTFISVALLLIILLRVLFAIGLAGIFNEQRFPEITPYSFWLASLLAASTMLGSGWGVTLTLASYNRFNENIEVISSKIAGGVMGIILLASTLTHYVDRYVEEKTGISSLYFRKHTGDFAYLGFPMFAASLEATHMWCLLFYVVLSISEINSIVIQTISVLTAIFDEFESKRETKKELTIILCSALFTLSLFFNNTYGFFSYIQLDGAAFSAQLFICLVELAILVLIYGRRRFMRDVSFMLGKPFKKWKFNVLRFGYPLPIFIMAIGQMQYPYHLFFSISYALKLAISFLRTLPFIAMPCFMLHQLYSMTGTLFERLKKSITPVDWYPADPAYRDRYNSIVVSSEISHQLVEMQRRAEQI